jgi:hypothetical protein
VVNHLRKGLRQLVLHDRRLLEIPGVKKGNITDEFIKGRIEGFKGFDELLAALNEYVKTNPEFDPETVVETQDNA